MCLNEAQIFFIYDTKHCVSEEDDPSDAILYFHPSDTRENVRCGICCQLAGLAQFCTSVFSEPTFVHLHRNKYAIKTVGRYILALSGIPSMPDTVLKRQLSSLYGLFEFYHNSIEDVRLVMKSASSESDFLHKMNEIWNFFLPVSQYFGNTLSLTFNILPSVDLPTSADNIFRGASQILQLCQTKSEVYAGCILSNNQVLCSQIPPSVVRHFYFIAPNKSEIPANFAAIPLPIGVTIYYIYMKKNILEGIQKKDFIQAAVDKNTEKNEKKDMENKETWFPGFNFGSAGEAWSQMRNGAEFHNDGVEHGHNMDKIYNKMKPIHTTENETIKQKLCLYIQGHSNTQLVLLASEALACSSETVDFLWQTGMSSLVQLEMDINHMNENSHKENIPKDYYYFQFEHNWNSIKIDEMIPMCPSEPAKQLFNRTGQIMHETFLNNPLLQETSLIFGNSTVYSHKMGSQETYFQETFQQSPITNLSSAVELVTNIQSSAHHKLEKDHSIMLK